MNLKLVYALIVLLVIGLMAQKEFSTHVEVEQADSKIITEEVIRDDDSAITPSTDSLYRWDKGNAGWYKIAPETPQKTKLENLYS